MFVLAARSKKLNLESMSQKSTVICGGGVCGVFFEWFLIEFVKQCFSEKAQSLSKFL